MSDTHRNSTTLPAQDAASEAPPVPRNYPQNPAGPLESGAPMSNRK